MRTKDESKQEALVQATVKLVNEIGFVASSVAKIAKEANISPATVYVYYENKEDLLVSTYVNIKKRMGAAILSDFDPNLPLRDTFRKLWINAFTEVVARPEEFQFTEQFSNTPYADLVDKEEIEAAFAPVIELICSGIEQKILKDVSLDVISAFLFFPVFSLANPRLCASFEKSENNIETAFNLAWDAVRL